MLDRLDRETELTLDRARVLAARLNHGGVGTEHVLLALLGDPRIADLLYRLSVTPADIRSAIEQRLQRGDRLVLDDALPRTAELDDALASAREEADGYGHAHVRNAHLLLGLIKEPTGIAERVLESAGTTLDGSRHEVLEFLAEFDVEEVGAA